MRLVVAAVASVILMTLDHRGPQLEVVRGALGTLLYPIQVLVDVPIRTGHWLAENLTSRGQLLEENARLRRDQLVLSSRLEKYEELEAENHRRRNLLESSEKVGERVLIAELMSVDMDPFSRRIVLNKGSRDGVREGQSLIDSRGVMGQIVHVGPFTSNALLITDPSHALPVQVNRNGLRAVAIGTGPLNRLRLSHVTNDADIEEGDTLVTSGLGGRFPRGYPVGTVVRVERDQGRPFASIVVEPSAELERNREVLLVWSDRTGERADDSIAHARARVPRRAH